MAAQPEAVLLWAIRTPSGMGRDRRPRHALETRVPRHGGRLLVGVLRQGAALVCTTWGIKGKNLYLLNVLRKRLEYPALKRAVREQQSLFHANVVLIEDKASGTQLIQELIVEGCGTVTKYQAGMR